MSFEKLDEIIWRHVLDFLTPSLPKPLSGLCKSEGKDQSPPEIAELPDSGDPGVTSRSDIRAPELSVLMRVSPAFNRLAAVPLYKRVITDDLMRLVDMRGGQAAHPGIASKNELLFLTKSLHLEYGIKNSASHRAKEKTYEPIMNQQDGMWVGVGRTTFTASILLAALEIDSILRSSIDHPAEHPYSIRFPNLTTLTVGAIFGGQDGVWQNMNRLSWDTAAPRRWFRFAARARSWQEAVIAAQIAMITTFSRSPITRFCQRGSLGPLSLPTAFQWNDFETPDPPPTTPLFTFHYDAYSPMTRIPAAIGSPSQWLLERPIRQTQRNALTHVIHPSVGLVEQNRDRILRRRGPITGTAPKETLQLTIYIPPASPQGQDKEEEETLANTRRALHLKWNKATKLSPGQEDKVVLRSMRESYPCTACGWTMT